MEAEPLMRKTLHASVSKSFLSPHQFSMTDLLLSKWVLWKEEPSPVGLLECGGVW